MDKENVEHTMEFYSAIKKLQFIEQKVELENIALNEVDQVQKRQWPHVLSHMRTLTSNL